jgi:hypothetical protein
MKLNDWISQRNAVLTQVLHHFEARTVQRIVNFHYSPKNATILPIKARVNSGRTLSELSLPFSPPDTAFYIFIQQMFVLNILNMLHNLSFSLFKMPFIS